MSKLILWMQSSADGYINGPNGEFDWPIVEHEMTEYALDQARSSSTFLYGRKVYEMMEEFWPTVDISTPSEEFHVELHDEVVSSFLRRFSRIWREIPKIVFSTTRERADWNTRVVGRNIAEEVNRLKETSDGDLVLFGGADIAAMFMQEGLLDEYRVFVHPVVLGGGTPLFKPLDERIELKLIEARSFDGGVVLHRYTPADS